MSKPLKAGFGRTDVTPQLGVRLGGYGVKERPAEEILDRLHATTMVLEQDGLMAAVINLDWICIEEDLVERIRQGSPFQYTLCCSVSNGSVSYLPTREARHRGGYECWVGRAGGAYLLADTIDDALVEQNLKLLRK